MSIGKVRANAPAEITGVTHPRTLPLRLAAGGVAVVLGLAGCAGTDAKQAQDAAGASSTTATGPTSSAGAGSGAPTTPSSPATSTGATAASTGELPLREDGTIDPVKFEALVHKPNARTLVQRDEMFQDGATEPIETYETTLFLQEEPYHFSVVEAIAEDGTRTPAAFAESKDDGSGGVDEWYWTYADGQWSESSMANLPRKMDEASKQHFTKVEPDGPDGIAQRRFHVEYSPLPEEFGGPEISMEEAILTYDDDWQQVKMRLHDKVNNYYHIYTVLSINEPVEFPKPPEDAHLKPADGVTIRG